MNKKWAVLIVFALLVFVAATVFASPRLLGNNTYVHDERVIPTGANKSGLPPATSPFEDDGSYISPGTQVVSSSSYNTSTSSTASSQSVPAKKCGELKNMRDRVQCRVTQSGVDSDDIPEECAVLTSTAKIRCKSNYDLTRKCLDQLGFERESCGRKAFILDNTANEKAKCATSADKDGCMTDLRERVDGLVKFRFNSLIAKAKKLLDKGKLDDEDVVVDFVKNVELKTIAYNSAKSTADKKQIVNDVKALWKSLVVKVK